MPRFMAAVLLLALVVQSTGLDMAWSGSCEAPCQDGDGDTQDCSCERCLCCSHHRHVTLTAGLTQQPRDLAAADAPAVGDLTPSADPNEIIHVPRRIGVRS